MTAPGKPMSVAPPVDVEFPAGGGAVPLRFALTGPAPVTDPAADSRLGVDIDRVSLRTAWRASTERAAR